MSGEPRAKDDELRLSVLVPAYLSLPTIAATLRALRLQTRPAHEVIVVESSGDGTAELVRRDFPEVRLVESSTRLYPGAARQTGLVDAGLGEVDIAMTSHARFGDGKLLGAGIEAGHCAFFADLLCEPEERVAGPATKIGDASAARDADRLQDTS